MKLSNKCYYILTLFFFIGCASKLSVVETSNSSVKDSIVYVTKKEVIPAIRDTLFVESPCDSLGNLKSFDKEIKTAKSAINLRSRNGKIEVLVEQDTLIVETIIQRNVKESNSTQTSDKEKVIYKTNTTVILILIISILLNILLIKLSAKKLIPFL